MTSTTMLRQAAIATLMDIQEHCNAVINSTESDNPAHQLALGIIAILKEKK